MLQWIMQLQAARDTYANVLVAILRYGAPILTFIILLRCLKPLLTFRREPEIWAWLCVSDGNRLPITHWENVIGRSKRSDIVIEVPTVSRSHGVLTRYDDGSWTISDSDSSDGILVNGKKEKIFALKPTDVISIGGVEMTLQPISRRQEQRLSQLRTKGSSFFTSLCNVLLLTVLQALCCLMFIRAGSNNTVRIADEIMHLRAPCYGGKSHSKIPAAYIPVMRICTGEIADNLRVLLSRRRTLTEHIVAPESNEHRSKNNERENDQTCAQYEVFCKKAAQEPVTSFRYVLRRKAQPSAVSNL